MHRINDCHTWCVEVRQSIQLRIAGPMRTKKSVAILFLL